MNLHFFLILVMITVDIAPPRGIAKSRPSVTGHCGLTRSLFQVPKVIIRTLPLWPASEDAVSARRPQAERSPLPSHSQLNPGP